MHPLYKDQKRKTSFNYRDNNLTFTHIDWLISPPKEQQALTPPLVFLRSVCYM